MEFLGEDPKPKVFFQSRPILSSIPPAPIQIQRKLNKIFVFISLLTSTTLASLSLFFLKNSQILQFITLWISSSLLLAPFAPQHLTGGDTRVGQGSTLHLPNPEPESHNSKPARRTRLRKSDDPGIIPDNRPSPTVCSNKQDQNMNLPARLKIDLEDPDWTAQDYELLKKLMAKNPVGKAKRWEVIAEGFHGRHGMESVIKMGKSSGDKKVGDSYVQFLIDRKPLNKRYDGNGVETWSSGEDIALLNALKAFQKDVSMRWEKISAAVPGKSKAACVKRVGELKKDFRSNKANSDA